MTVFPGRASEVALIAERLTAVAEGRGAIVLVTGEPGIGKTRLLEEAAAHALARGFAVVWGRVPELGAAPPYWPWIEAARALVARPETAAAPATATLARLLPEVLGPVAPAVVSAGSPGPVDAFPVHDAIAAMLHATAARTPVLILLDDLHAADPSSLQVAELVARAVRATRVMILGSYRDLEARRTPAIEASLARLGRHGEVLCPRRLDRAEVAVLVRATLAHDEPEVSRMIHDASEGNPLFVRELLKLIVSHGGKGKAGAGATPGAPSAARVVIRERLALLSPSSVALLQAAAIVGREFAPVVAAEVAGVTGEALDDALAEARDAEIVVAIADGRWQFSHALVAETLAADAPAGVRARLHRRAAEALERRAANLAHGDSGIATARADTPFEAIAWHWRMAGSDQAERAAAASEKAALASLRRLAFADAGARYADALASLDALSIAATPPTPELARRRVEMLVAQTTAFTRANDRGKAAESVARAVELARALADRALEARAALAFGAEVLVGQVDATLVRRLEEALARFPEATSAAPADAAWRALLTARLASALQPARDVDGPMRTAREALAQARRLDDDALLAEVLFAVGGALADYGPPAERAAIDEACARAMLARGDRARAMRCLQRLAFDRVDLGDRAGFDAVVAELAAHAEAVGLPRLRAMAPMLRGMQAGWEGRHDDEARFIEDAFALREQAGDQFVAAARRTRATFAAFMRSHAQPDETFEVLRDSLVTGAMVAYVPIMRAWTCALAGRRDEARALFASFDRGLIARHASDIHFVATLGDVVWYLRDARLGPAAYDALARHAGRPTTITGVAALLTGFVDHQLMRVALVLGRDADAERWAASARALCTRLGARPWLDAIDHDLAAWAATPTTPATATATITEGGTALTLTRAGDVWTVSGFGATCCVKDSRGMRMLERLVAEPGREQHVLDLSGGAGVIDLGDAGAVLDASARRAYQQRLAALDEELDEAARWHDEGRRAKLEAERERLTAELAAAFGLGGRAKKTGAAVERARSNVRRRIADAMARLAEVSPALGVHLERAVRTGVYCSYNP